MPNPNNVKALYDELQSTYDLGSYEDFLNYLSDDKNREALRKELSEEYDVGDIAQFSEYLGFGTGHDALEQFKQQTEGNTGTPNYVPNRFGMPTQQGEGPVAPTANAQPTTEPQQQHDNTQYNYMPMGSIQTPAANQPAYTPQRKPMAPAPRAGQWSGAPMQQTPYAPTDAEGNKSYMPLEQGEDTRQAYAGRKQAKRDLWQQQSDNVESLLAASEKRDMEAGTKRTIFTDYGSEEVVTPKRSNETRELRAAQRALRNTQRIINAADNEAGFGQGLKERVFDIDNWDFGITDITDLNALKRAMDAFDKGEKLTESQQALLDAKALEMAVNVYFASDLSKGYQAGQDIAGSLPFMAEFMLGIGSAASKATSKALVKYFTKRFAKAMENKAVNTAVRGGARVLRDLERAGIMTGTSGAVSTEADARQRMMGQVRYDEDEQGKVTYAGHTQGEDEWKARRKAATARTLTNFSEMFGEYLGFLGKGGRWLSGTKGGKFFGLDKVAGFIDNVAKSDIGSFIGRIESKAQFHGAVGEMAEELFDGVTNATFVGDQTLQDVFDKENLTRTALSVGIMSMFFSGAKLGGYGVAKGFNAADMAVRTRRADRAAANAFGTQWDGVRGQLDGATAEQAADIIQGMYESGEYTDEQLQSALNYAIYKKGNEMIERYKANNQTQQEAATEQSYNTGYEDATTDELRGGIEKAYNDARQTLVGLIGEDNVAVIDEDPLGMQRLYDNDPKVDDAVTWAVAAYVSAKSAWDGVQQRIADDAEDRAEAVREAYKPMTREDGYIHPVTLNVEGADGQPKTVYLLDGSDVVLNPDGSIDRVKSSPTLTAYDPEQGKPVFIDDPYGDRGIQSVGEVTTPEALDQLAGGGVDGQGALNTGGNNGQVARIPIDGQDARNSEDGQGARAPERTPGAPEAYTPGMVIGVVDNAGQEHVAEVAGRVRYDKGKFVPDENGMFVEFTVDGQTKHEATDKLNGMVRWHETGGVDTIEPIEGIEGQAPTAQAETPTEGGNTAEDTRTPAQRTFDEVTAKYGDKASHKVDVTLKDRKATLDTKKKALDKAQTDYDDAPIGKEDKADAALAKAQEEYDNALADYNSWDEVRKLRDQALLAQAEQEEQQRKAEQERRLAEETEAQRKQREAYEAEQARRKAEAEAVEKRRQEENARLRAEEEERKNNPQPAVEPAPIEGTKGQASQLEIARQEMADDPGALAMLEDMEPRTLEEVASRLLSSGKNRVRLIKDDFMRETGYTPEDVKRYPFVFATADKGGITLARFGEMVAAEARNNGIPFDENDPMAGVTAALNMLGGVGSQGDINAYVAGSRIQQAYDYHNAALAAERTNMLEAYGMTDEEYESYMSWLEDAIEQGKSTLSDEEFNQIFDLYEQGQTTDAAGGNQEGAETTERPESAETDVSQNGERGNGETDAGTAEQPQQPAVGTAQQPKAETWEEHVNKAMDVYDKEYAAIEKSDGERLRKEAAGYSDERLLNTYIRNAGISQIFGKGREGMRKFVSEEKNYKAEKLDDVKENHLEAAPDAARQSFVQDVLRAELDRRGIEYKEEYTFAETSDAEDWYKKNVESKTEQPRAAGSETEGLIEEMAAVDERERSLAGKPGYNEAYNAKAALADRIAEVAGKLPTKDLQSIHKEAKKRGMHSIMAHVESELLKRRDAGKKQKADGKAARVSARERKLRDAIVDLLRKAGIDVVTESEEGQRVLDMANGRERQHRVYHGSGADFEAFDHSHMGEGEGAQAFGWGTYVTEVEGIGKKYANSYGSVTMMMNGMPINDVLRNEDYWDSAFNWFVTGRERTLDELKEHISNTYIDGRIAGPRSKRARAFQEQKKRLLDAIERGEVTPNKDFTPIIYTVEIPEDNGSNYLEWDKPIGAELAKKLQDFAFEQIMNADYRRFYPLGEEQARADLQRVIEPESDMAWVNRALEGRNISAKAISEFLHSAGFVGIKYPAEYYSGGRSDGAKNYVIFDESDLQITDKVKFFRTENGEAYGFTMDGKIYLDPKIATAETPIHEYTHLWAAALRAANPKAWEQLKSELAKDTKLISYVQRLYPELAESNGANGSNGLSDELAEEVFAHFSGRRGAERLREEQRQAMESANDYVEKAGVVAMFERLRDALKKFWNMARDLFAGKTRGIKSRSAEDFADMVLGDLVGGFKPDRGDRVDRNDRERDAEYMEAVNSGDMEKAQRMVNEAAKRAMSDTKVVDENGNPLVVYHGGKGNIIVFDKNRIGENLDYGTMGAGFYFTSDRENAENYARNAKGEGEPSVERVFINIRNIKEVNWNELDGESKKKSEAFTAKVIAKGYDGLTAYAPNGAWWYVAFDPSQIKSADPVTYDDNGNVIPLSERFNSGNEDIRYQRGATDSGVRFRGEEEPVFYSNALRAVEGIKQEKATPEQWLKMIEKNGGLKAGEDKWLGLSEWLKGSDAKTLTKGEVLDYIRANEIQVEEVEYRENKAHTYEETRSRFIEKAKDYIEEYGIYEFAEEYGEEVADLFSPGYNNSTGEEDWTNIRVTDEDALKEYLYNHYDIFDENSSDILPINSTRLQYTTEGLDNKREIVLTVPTIEPWNEQDEVHFGEAGGGRAVAWVRFGETTDADGKRVLVIDEIQSKRHQEGREKGYRKDGAQDAVIKANIKRIEAQSSYDLYVSRLAKKYNCERDDIYSYANDAEITQVEEYKKAVENAEEAYEKAYQENNGVPDAPFDKNWHEVAMKRMLRFAAENGYDKVAWTKGEQQAERYNLSTLLDHIDVYPHADEMTGKRVSGEYTVIPVDKSGNYMIASTDHPFSGNLTADEVLQYYGKDLGTRMMQAADNARDDEKSTIEGDGLRIGGEGMKGFYDQILPRFMDKYGKKWGVKTGEVRLDGLSGSNGENGVVMHAVDVTDDMRESVMRGQPLFRPKTQSREGGEEAAQGDWYDRGSVERIGEFVGYSPKRIAAMNARQEQTARNKFRDAAEKLHLGDRITFVDTIDEIEGIGEEQRKAWRRKKGWYSPRTGKIVIILGNHKSMDDVMKSILHEGVAHHGLRQMFGVHFDTFLDNVYLLASSEIRERINEMAKKHGWDFREATEEYLATLAEDTDFERPENQSWWKKVKAMFIDLLHKIGFRLHDVYDTITDNELRYILWRSYENLVNPGRYNSVVEEAKDVAKQYELKVGRWDVEWTIEDREPNATTMYNGRRIAVWATNGRREERENREDRADRTDRTDMVDRKEWIRAVAEAKRHWPGAMVLEHVGDFYVVHGEDARKVAKVLGLPLVQRSGNDTVGFPAYEVDTYLPKLVRAGERVALIDSVNEDAVMYGGENIEAEDAAEYAKETERIEQEARDNGTWMKAPNGKRSNLTEKQWVMVRTKAFKRWFGDWQNDPDNASRVVDENGEPLVVYHGTPYSFTEFEDEGDKGIFFSSIDRASWYVKGDDYPQIRKIIKPFESWDDVKAFAEKNDIEFEKADEEEYDDAYILHGEYVFSLEEALDKAQEYFDNIYGDGGIIPVFLNIRKPRYIDAKGKYAINVNQFRNRKSQDGVIVENVNDPTFDEGSDFEDTNYIVYSPNQIKSATSNNGNFDPSSNDIRFRDGDFSERDEVTARDYYERMVSSSRYQFREAVQDSMLGLRKAYEAILGGGKKFRIEEVPGNENAYLAENRMSSVNAAEQHNYFVECMKPLLEEIHKICGSDKALRQELTDYMMAKHGLERNRVFAERDAQNGQNALNGQGARTPQNGQGARAPERDYAGLTALTGMADVHDAELAAMQMVADFEARHDVSKLWAATKKATGVTLAKIYRSGLLSKESYEQIRDQFEWYIPLQGFDETTSDEVYGYLTSRQGPYGSPIKHAEGRSSKADDPIATIGMMADMAIRQANRNEMKKLFLNFVLDHPSDLVSVNRLWLQYDDVSGDWVPVFADIEEGDTAADVERKVAAFEERMEQLAAAEPDKYKHGRNAKNIPYRVLPGNLSEHQVLVKRDGETYVLTINGNPRAAQALNGLTNPDVKTGGFIGGFMKASSTVNRFLSSAYTTRTPDFVVSNFFRDMLYSNCMAWVKDTPNYALRFHKNFGKFNPATMRVLFGKWEKGTLDESKPIEFMFKQFMLNGGETGYTNVRDIEAHKREIVRELKRQGNVPRKAWHAFGMQLDLVNRSVENCARFAAFITSQEMGRSVERSIYDAKEVSVNFNKKGSGDKMMGAEGQTRIGNVAAFLSGAGRCLQVFWNAGVQGMTNFGRAAKHHPGKFSAGAATMFALGAIVPLLAKALGDDDDDENAYYNLPEYVRRSNICFRRTKEMPWITIPLPIEFRAIYGLGELGTGVITGDEHYSDSELARQLIAQVSQILPLDFMEGQGGLHNLWPSWAKPIVEAHSNKGWTGLPIYRGDKYPKDKLKPEYQMVYKNADKNLVAASKWLNELTGGDDYTKGWADKVNPAQVEYVLNGYLGGWFKVPNQLMKMGETAFGDREFEWRNMMLANRLIKNGDERTANRKLQNEYFQLKEEYEKTKNRIKGYEKEANEGVLKYAEKLAFLNESKEYGRYLIFDEYRKEIDKLYKQMKEEEGEQRKATEEEYYSVVREMVDKVHEYNKGR